MRIILRCIVFAIGFASEGCFTSTALKSYEIAPDSSTVVFNLFDGRSVKSYAGKHRRIEDGYQLTGEVSVGDHTASAFEGIITDDEIKEAKISQHNPTGTAILLAGVAVTLLLILTRWGTSSP